MFGVRTRIRPHGAHRRLAAAVLLALVLPLLLGALPAGADGPVLHELLPPDPGEDLSFGTTTLDGDLPAALQTPSGLATAPDPRRPPDPRRVYAGSTTDDGPETTYEPDRDTRRPDVESYDDPFSPATAPFKRLRAYDAVDAAYTLRVQNRALRPVPVGGAVGPGDEPFYGDLSVDLVPGQPVRIPTVGPGARLVRIHVEPAVPVTVLRDGADNWFVRGASPGRVRLVVELAIARAAFGSDFADVEWSELDKLGHPQPATHRAAFLEVAQAIGVSRALRPREAVRKMVAYFRAFAPSDDPPRGRDDIYLDLALSRKGVCRHRAFAFLVTALNLGIPARMVVNEAHAWVEVGDGALWHRIDLGGAARQLDTAPDADKPAYVPPPDPYAWPDARDSGQDLAERARAEEQERQPPGGPGTASSASPSASGPAAPSGSAQGAPPASSSTAEVDAPKGPEAELAIKAVDGDVRRGFPLHVKGDVTAASAPCAHARVDVVLRGRGLPDAVLVGSLSNQDHPAFDGAVVVPRDLPPGDYELSVTTPGDARCGPGASR
jgi:hypothetical protein